MTSETELRVQRGIDYFKQGYNCSQSVALAFADRYGIPEPLMARLAASFGNKMQMNNMGHSVGETEIGWYAVDTVGDIVVDVPISKLLVSLLPVGYSKSIGLIDTNYFRRYNGRCIKPLKS